MDSGHPNDASHSAMRIVVTIAVLLLAGGALCCGGFYLFGQRVVESVAPSHVGSGVLAEQKRLVDGFDAIHLEAPAGVHVEIGSEFSVLLRADDDLLQFVDTSVVDGVLRVRARERFTAKAGVDVLVTMPTLRAVTCDGLGDVFVEGVESDRLDVVVRGVGVVRASGTCGQLDVVVEGVGDALLADLVAERVTAKTSGTGNAEVHATESLAAVVEGIGDVRYRGDPATLTPTVSGLGDVIPIR